MIQDKDIIPDILSPTRSLIPELRSPTRSLSQMYAVEIVAMLGRRFKDYRIGSDMTQKQVSEKAGVSIITIRNFENGKLHNISMGTFIELLRAIDFMQGLDDVLPEIPVSPYELEKIQQGKRKRVRHAK